MITYEKFKKIIDNLDSNREPEIEIYFNNKDYNYMIIKYSDHITFQRCGKKKDQSGEIRFNSLDELYNVKTIDEIILKEEWKNITDILIDCTFSVVDDKDDIKNLYGVSL